MTLSTTFASPQVIEIMNFAQKLSSSQRLLVAKLLIDSIVTSDVDDDSDWQALGLASFTSDWDNSEDAIYDNWREIYGVQTR